MHRDIDGGFTFLGQFDFKSTVPQPCDSSLGLVVGIPLLLVLNQKELRHLRFIGSIELQRKPKLRQLRIPSLYSIEAAGMIAVSSEYRVVRLHRDIDGCFTFERQFDFKSTVPTTLRFIAGVGGRNSIAIGSQSKRAAAAADSRFIFY